jgi:hypothetical protein
MTPAELLMHEANPHAAIGEENDLIKMVQEVSDLEGRLYKLEIVSTKDASHANAYCLWNPWGESPNAGESYNVGHVKDTGLLCLGKGTTENVLESPFTLDFVLPRAAFWVTGFSVLKESGHFPQL